MIDERIVKIIIKEDKKFKKNNRYRTPKYSPGDHYKHLCDNNYYHALIVFRHFIKVVSDFYFSEKQEAKNIDLFMFTSSISSPMGPGSDSEPVSAMLGKLKTFLTDSSQFGFEPLLLNGFNKVYCYLPSIRGEDCDSRHLNQFFHCEMEMRGKINDLFPVIEGYVKALAEAVLLMDNIIERISENSDKTRQHLKEILQAKILPKITFDEAVGLLAKKGKKSLVNFTDHGNDISCEGEIELTKILKVKTPVWITDFDRDRVPFYQKPNPNNHEKTINADLLFPPIIKGAFGGEIIGAGQRQDSVNEIYESLKRQKNLSAEPYEWYIDLRSHPNYKTTSGFGFGVERFIAWALGKENIRDVILYPRIKNIKTFP